MRIIADTNVLLRPLLPDDGHRVAAIAELAAADSIAISLHALCELVWVLSRRYGTSRADIAAAIRGLVAVGNVVVDRAAERGRAETGPTERSRFAGASYVG